MKIIINDMANQPLQRQIFERIREMILSGLLHADEELPSIRAFARQHKVSVITVQKAYQLLEQDGLIYSRRGKGFFVAEISSDNKNIIAADTFENAFSPIYRKAVREGLSIENIYEIIKKVIEEK